MVTAAAAAAGAGEAAAVEAVFGIDPSVRRGRGASWAAGMPE